MKPIKILLADDHGIVRSGIRMLLESQPDFEVVGEAEDGWEAIRMTEQLMPDVIVMDIAMPRLGGLDALCEIRKRTPNVRVVILSIYDREEFFFKAIKAGGSGYILKEGNPEELLMAIRSAYRGDIFLAPSVAKSVLTDYLNINESNQSNKFDSLTLRQKEVLQLIGEGKTTAEIAETLCLSIKTVEKHRSNILRALELQTPRELLHYAYRKNILNNH